MGRLRRLRPEECLPPSESADAVIQSGRKREPPPQPLQLHQATCTEVCPEPAAPPSDSSGCGSAGSSLGSAVGHTGARGGACLTSISTADSKGEAADSCEGAAAGHERVREASAVPARTTKALSRGEATGNSEGGTTSHGIGRESNAGPANAKIAPSVAHLEVEPKPTALPWDSGSSGVAGSTPGKGICCGRGEEDSAGLTSTKRAASPTCTEVEWEAATQTRHTAGGRASGSRGKGTGYGRGRGAGVGRATSKKAASPGGVAPKAASSSAAESRQGTGMPEPEAKGQSALIQDYIVLRHVLEAEAAGVPKLEILKWVVDLQRNFFVQDDSSFELAWYDLFDAWIKSQRRRANQQRKREAFGAHSRLYGAESAFRDAQPDAEQPEPVKSAANQKAETPQTRKRGRARAPVRFSALPEIRACALAAKKDVENGVCESYDHALAVRLALALGKAAPKAMAEVAPDAAARGGLDVAVEDEGKLLKRLALFVHPDKTKHPQAKEAFQRLRERVW